MMRMLVIALMAVQLVGCVTTMAPVPKGYSGPVATVKDTVHAKGGESCGEWYYLDAYAGKDVDNAFSASVIANQNAGPVFRDYATSAFSRAVPANAATFHIAGRTHCAAPILEMVKTMHLIHGNVSFTPEADHTYTVKGELTTDHGAVWVEDDKTNAQVGNRLFIRGEPKQGFFDQKGTVTEIPPSGIVATPNPAAGN